MKAHHAPDRVLIVEDDESVAVLLERIIRRHSDRIETRIIGDARMALPVFREYAPDLVIMDVQLPHLDGISAMQQIRSRTVREDFLPFLLITGDVTAETRQRALDAGAADFLTKPFDGAEVILRVRNLLALRSTQRDLKDALQRSEDQLERLQEDMVARLTLAVKLGTPESGADAEQVGELSAHIARALGLPDVDAARIKLAAPLHDIGMFGVSETILANTGSLSLEELDAMRGHTALGARILMNSDLPLMQLAEEIALYHHEAWDGSGYTPGLAGESIPIAARIVAVADTYCSMIGRRAYQNSHSPETAIMWIESQSGTRFDPGVVEAFKRVCGMDDLPLLPQRSMERDG